VEADPHQGVLTHDDEDGELSVYRAKAQHERSHPSQGFPMIAVFCG